MLDLNDQKLFCDQTKNHYKIFVNQQVAEKISQFSSAQQSQIKDYLLALNPEAVRPRSKLFRALGDNDPPSEIEINHEIYHKVEVFKHDSWAATVLYANQSSSSKIVCKFNRQQSIFGFSMKWLGVRLAQRENKLLKLLANSPYIPPYSGEVRLNGKILQNASAHGYVEGMPLRRYQQPLADDFFPKLQGLLNTIHQHQISYMDMNKQENILVKKNGDPCLIDFQICFHLSQQWPGCSAPFRYLLKLLQESDRYHLMKHYTRFRPDLFTPETLAQARTRPWFLNVYRCIQIPLRTLRRRLLVLLGFRDKSGHVTSESFVEDGMRNHSADFKIKNVEILGYQLILKYQPKNKILYVSSIT